VFDGIQTGIYGEFRRNLLKNGGAINVKGVGESRP
jgi:hypothetical protein